jgi:hypothetical protein
VEAVVAVLLLLPHAVVELAVMVPPVVVVVEAVVAALLDCCTPTQWVMPTHCFDVSTWTLFDATLSSSKGLAVLFSPLQRTSATSPSSLLAPRPCPFNKEGRQALL